MTHRSGLRDLAEQLQKLASAHFESGRAYPVVSMACEHLCAIARVEEANQEAMSKSYPQEPVDADGWTAWCAPKYKGFRMECCDCGLVHTFEFRINKGGIEFRAQRHERSTAQVRRYMRARPKTKR